MRGQFLNNKSDLANLSNGNVALQEGYPKYSNQRPPNVLQPVDFGSSDYRYMFKNPLQSTPSGSPIHTCFVGFMQTGESSKFGPFILNITPDEESKNIKIVDLDLDFFNEDQFISNNPSQGRTILNIQKKLEMAITDPMKLSNKESGSSSDFLKEYFSTCEIRFKMTPLPFDHYFINSKRVPSVDYGCQTVDDSSRETRKAEDMINILREEIMLLKDQNQLLRQQQQLALRRSSSRSTKEYVLRKQPQYTAKSTRNNSAISSQIMIEAQSMNSEKSHTRHADLTNLTLLTNENSSLQEMLQEYMLENEALRKMNNSLEEVRASHHSELDIISQRNKELAIKVEELSKKVKSDHSSGPLLNELKSVQKDYLLNKNDNTPTGFPITFEKLDGKSKNSSYLMQYDVLRSKQQNENLKSSVVRGKVHNVESSPAKSKDSLFETRQERKPVNESLLEELNRIDMTIKEHIKMNQFNGTLRNMGKRQSPKKN